jgi:hypothetical protein
MVISDYVILMNTVYKKLEKRWGKCNKRTGRGKPKGK